MEITGEGIKGKSVAKSEFFRGWRI